MLRRLAAVTALVALSATSPASALHDSHSCDREGSVRVITANNEAYKLWVWSFTHAFGFMEHHVCFGVGDTARGDFVVRTPLSPTLPLITLAGDPELCPVLLDLEDPAPLLLRFGQAVGGATPVQLCVGAGDTVLNVAVGPPGQYTEQVSVDLYLDRQTALADLYCQRQPGDHCDFFGSVHIPLV